MRCFVDNHSSCLFRQFVQNCLSFFFICRKKCFKCESSCGQSGNGQRCDACCCPRNCCHSDSCFLTHRHQFLSRIRDSRCSRICDQCDIFTIFQVLDQRMRFRNFIVFMITGHRCVNIKMIQKLNAIASILCCDQINFF